MSNIIDFFKETGGTLFEQAKETVLSKVTDFFRSTDLGKKVEKTATKQAITDYLKNPLVIVILIVIGYFIFKGLKR